MKLGAIITGDIVDSTRLTLDERETMLSSLRFIPVLLSSIQPNVSIEIFRGDGFQIGTVDAESALKSAIIVRAWLRSHEVGNSGRVLDARMALGVGKIDFSSDSLSTSDGEAFQLSGRLLDRMDKSRLEIVTPWRCVNDELKVSTSFADEIISSWTKRQSEVVIPCLLTSKSHLEISQELNISRQMVDKALKAAKEELIRDYIERYRNLIHEHTAKQ